MKLLKITLALTLFLIATQAIAQNKKMIAKGEEKAAEINQEIVSVNPGLALSAGQIKMIAEIHAKKLMDIRALKDMDLTPEQVEAKTKALHQEAGKNINQKVLTKEQRKARREARDKKNG